MLFRSDLHFIHARSERTDAIPLILLHGWPGEYRGNTSKCVVQYLIDFLGTFFDFHKVIEPLINPPDGQIAYVLHILLCQDTDLMAI